MTGYWLIDVTCMTLLFGVWTLIALGVAEEWRSWRKRKANNLRLEDLGRKWGGE